MLTPAFVAVGVANGTDALARSLRALGIGRGDEVVVATNTSVATVEAVVLASATPRPADGAPHESAVEVRGAEGVDDVGR